LGTLTQEGEWYYDEAAKRLYMHFGSGTPAGQTVKVSKLDRNFTINSQNNIAINNIDFQGSNINGVFIIGARGITFNNCSFIQHGGNGLYGIGVSDITMHKGQFVDVLNTGIWVEDEGENITIDGVRTLNLGMFAGAGRSGDGSHEGISIRGNNTTITNCTVINTGFNGINFSGDNVLVEHNFVDTFCMIKDDGAGIYTYNSHNTAVNRKIKSNIVLNAIGAFSGAESNSWEPYGKAAGIYLDDKSYNTEVDNNTLANGEWGGIFLNNNGNNKITNNRVYNFGQQLLIAAYSSSTTRNLIITDNTFIAKKAGQKAFYIYMNANDDIRLMGKFNNNKYARPVDDNATFTIDKKYSGGGGAEDITLGTWKTEYAQDVNSSKSMTATDSEDNLDFRYNNSNEEVTVPLNSSYSDVTGKTYASGVKLPAYGGIVLIKAASSDFVESVHSGNWTDPAVWSSGHVPRINESVRINQGHIIKVQQDITSKSVQVSAGGELVFLGDYDVNN
jgi:parallel beta-helix repeat protein